MKTRRTRQLAAVYDVVSAAHDHPSAEEICARVRRRLPRISLGTVYRNLQKLAEQRRLQVVQLMERPARYDGMVEDHDHFLCEDCGAVTDFLRAAAARPDCSLLTQSGFHVRAHALTFYGLCPRCRGAQDQQRGSDRHRARRAARGQLRRGS